MKKETIFELNESYRLMEDQELAYMLTENMDFVQKHEEITSMRQILEEMPPLRRKIALAAIELYKRNCSVAGLHPIINCSQDIYYLMQPVMEDLVTEECWIILLNHASGVIRKIRISCGGYTSVPIDVRVVLREALLYRATRLVLCHNHPSGNTTPSVDDDRITQMLCQAAAQVDISVTDHIIVSNESYYSYADHERI